MFALASRTILSETLLRVGIAGLMLLLTAQGVDAQPSKERVSSKRGSPSGPSLSFPEAGTAWLTKLPSYQAVQTAFPTEAGGDMSRQTAAFAILVDFLEVRVGAAKFAVGPKRFEGVPPEVVEAWRRYVGGGYSMGLIGPEARYFDMPDFRVEVLSKYFSGPELMAYGRASGVPLNPMAHGPASSVPLNPTSARVDRSVFGIGLGAPLSLPQCREEDLQLELGVGRGGDVTCWGDSAGTLVQGMVGLLLHGAGDTAGAGRLGNTVMVRLAETSCPDWVKAGGTCVVAVTRQDGIVTAIFITVAGAGSQATIADEISEKYGAPPRSVVPPLQCRNNLTGIVLGTASILEWSPDGLFVRYEPFLTDDCGHGIVKVALEAYRQKELRTEKKRQPKM